MGSPSESCRLLLRAREPPAQMGLGPGNHSLRAGPTGCGAMVKKKLLDAIKERPLLGDGAMGTQLMIAGLEQGNCGEAWNLTHPERVLAIQRRYAEAGSDCLLTNTFGGSGIMLNRHGQRDKVAEINRAGVAIAREALGGGGGVGCGAR